MRPGQASGCPAATWPSPRRTGNRYPGAFLVFNGHMRRSLSAVTLALGALLVAPVGSLATISEVGQVGGTRSATPSCPTSPCLAVSRTSGFQVKVGATSRSMFTVPRSGKIVAWTITLGKPSAKQIKYFDSTEGGPASAAVSVLRSGRHLTYRLLAESPTQLLQPYFGQTVQFPLDQSLPVSKGQIVALTVPTWAPALALGFANTTSWRASRAKGKCSDTTTQAAHIQVSSVLTYTCLYRTARLTYSATLISTP